MKSLLNSSDMNEKKKIEKKKQVLRALDWKL
jgi:hypothetical protein